MGGIPTVDRSAGLPVSAPGVSMEKRDRSAGSPTMFAALSSTMSLARVAKPSGKALSAADSRAETASANRSASIVAGRTPIDHQKGVVNADVG